MVTDEVTTGVNAMFISYEFPELGLDKQKLVRKILGHANWGDLPDDQFDYHSFQHEKLLFLAWQKFKNEGKLLILNRNFE